MSQEETHDAHLLAALRHAPDRDVAPPAQLSAAILGQARQAVRAQRHAQPSRWHALWASLWQPAPMAAFGTIALATLIGVIWQGQDVPEAAPSLRPQVVAAAPTQSTAVPISAPAAPPVRPAPAAPAVPPALDSPTVLSPSKEGPAAQAAPATLPELAKGRIAPDRKGLPSASSGRAEIQAQPDRAVERAAAAEKSAPRAAQQAAPREPETRRDALAKSSMADAAVPAPAPERAAAGAPAPAPAAAPVVARARSEMPAVSLGAALAPPASPLAQASAEIDAASDVRWRARPERLFAHDAAQRAWWLALDRATQGRWQLVATALAAPTADMTLLIDGQVRGSLSFAPQAVLWRDANGLIWRAPVAPETLREWQDALARW
ncbi:MAG: hypothetical protein Q8L49_06880 [Burkholderiaceae bacterium]|nr:hypothetical protein [Burkholderiaceae bacterium]